LGLLPKSIRERHVDKLVTAMERQLTLYLEPREVQELMDELRQCVIEGGTTSTASDSIEIDIDGNVDVSLARDEAMKMALKNGLGKFKAVKVATVVSELARNIISYARAGMIELRPLEGLKRGVMVIATDSGPGIPHLDQVLNGQWRSPKSMGQGIRGCIKVMTTFDIKTVEGVGTTITTTMVADL